MIISSSMIPTTLATNYIVEEFADYDSPARLSRETRDQSTAFCEKTTEPRTKEERSDQLAATGAGNQEEGNDEQIRDDSTTRWGAKDLSKKVQTSSRRN
ncbi:hypothetical protein MY4038_004434 [Beauveria bassiana]